MDMFWNGIEQGSDIQTVSTVSGNVAQFSISTLAKYSEVDGIQYRCEESEGEKIIDSQSFSCTYESDGTYKVRYYVYTTVNNIFLFEESVTIKQQESDSSESTGISSVSLESTGSSNSCSPANPSRLLSLFVGQYLLAIILVLFVRA